MHSGSHFVDLWINSGLVIKTTAGILLSMSVFSWTIMLVKARQIYIAMGQAKKLVGFWNAPNPLQAIDTLQSTEQDKNPFLLILKQGQKTMQHQRHESALVQSSREAQESFVLQLRVVLDEFKQSLGGGLIILASVSSTAPFIGLFGTVWGIYQALMVIGGVGLNGLDQVAGPIGEALVMTAFGLAVAIPAALGYNFVRQGNQLIVSKLNRFAENMRNVYLVEAAYQHQSIDQSI
ncbi:biopolymer transport protein ExbB [Polynucleobacter meluiroseus]|uniref:Biopolymer transport protein ExbB n=1 Tax=Polynucleobacter meluiroseus TaxID=1938814 RepID=A0A240DY63_9BURK|nr:MotA/TolQ/ExbB proton channel family protein [Polynucleobacter meluiroseus]SNX28135.1 biopolymer transport protein ExbB [Polynucleobacter meluiroseus]